eukprot:m.7428 g.7428  ORF g.7428 m.7428 type:complete len:290 (+) comp8821_c0_seq1:56-925(+)
MRLSAVLRAARSIKTCTGTSWRASLPVMAELLESTTHLDPQAHVDTTKLAKTVPKGTKPVVLVACGSFSPITFMHLRLLEDCKNSVNSQAGLHVIGGYISPVHNLYGKKSLAPAHDRINMARLAVAESHWLNVDTWECAQNRWNRSAVVLQRFADDLAEFPVTIADTGDKADSVKVMLVCGADLLESFDTVLEDGTDLWSAEDRNTIASNGIACLLREGTDLDAVVERQPILRKQRDNIQFVEAAAKNTISSTVVRRLLATNQSITYLVPLAVEKYIYQHKLQHLPNWQ